MGKSIIVTGLTGFIGYHILEPLINAGFEVIITNRQHHLKEYQLDILNSEHIKYIMEYHKPEYLLHLAWDVNPGYLDNPNNVDWMNASLNLVHQFANNGGRKVVIAGTCFDHNPKSLYGTCKRSLWNILNYARFADSLELAYGRIYYLYGTNEPKQRLVPTIINGLLDNKVVELKSLAEQSMNLSYVQDVADALVYALDKDVQGEFDILGENTTIGTIAKTITDLMDIDNNQVICGVENLLEIPKYAYDKVNAGKLKTKGWEPKVSLQRGLVKTIQFWEGQRLDKKGL